MTEKVLVRLSGRGQYELADATLLAELNELDNEIVALLTQTESRLAHLLAKMVQRVEAEGTPVQNRIQASNLVLPPTDLSLAEAAELFAGEGILPG